MRCAIVASRAFLVPEATIAQRQGNARLGREHRVAGGEDQAQQVVADVVLLGFGQRIDEVGHDVRLKGIEVGADFLVLARLHRGMAQPVEGAVLGSGHQPGPGVVGHTVRGPVFERGDQRVLGQFLGQTDIAGQARDAGDDLGRLDAPDGLDRAVRRRGVRHSAWRRGPRASLRPTWNRRGPRRKCRSVCAWCVPFSGLR